MYFCIWLLDNNKFSTKDCPKSFPTWAIIAIIIGGVFIFGIVILFIWKILDTLQQKRECARFNEERKKAAWEAVRVFFFLLCCFFLKLNLIKLIFLFKERKSFV